MIRRLLMPILLLSAAASLRACGLDNVAAPPPPPPLAPPASPLIYDAQGHITAAIETNNQAAADLAKADAPTAALDVRQTAGYLDQAAQSISAGLSAATAKDAEATALHAQATKSTAALAQATAQLTAATADRDKWQSLYQSSWLGGRFYFWWWTAVGLLTAVGIAMFVAEFFFGLNIHPLTWILEAGKLLGAAIIRAAATIIALFKRNPAPQT